MSISYPERIELARTPTPLQRLDRTSELLGVEIYLKRDDMTGAELSGNKVRKLEFLLRDALEQGADTIVTCGGEQSNHCRATALAATRLGLRSRLLLRTRHPEQPPPARGNILLDRLAGAEIRWLSHAQYARRKEIFEQEAAELRDRGAHPYLIPEGGSNAVGAWGYVRAAEELRGDLEALPRTPTTVIHACGSGGTAAGLLLGAELFDFASMNVRVACVNVCDDRAYHTRAIGDICTAFAQRYGLATDARIENLEIIDGYVGLGYAKSRAEELVVLRDLARREAVILDPVYTGKAYFGMLAELQKKQHRFGERIVFVHTGGMFGLFPTAAQLEPLL